MMSQINSSQTTVDNLSSTNLSRILQVSRATLSRWVQRGCPFQKEENSREHQFNLNAVLNWIDQECHGKTFRSLPTRRQLKRYWIFDWEGRYKECVSGSHNAYKSLTYFGRDEFYRARACAVDASGIEYVAYGGKLRRYNPRFHKDDIEWDESDIEMPESEQ
jgi:hypothetical protein